MDFKFQKLYIFVFSGEFDKIVDITIHLTNPTFFGKKGAEYCVVALFYDSVYLCTKVKKN